MMERKTILFVLPFFPYPLVSGGHQAIFNGILAISDRYNAILTYEVGDCPQYRENERLFLKRIPNAVLCPSFLKRRKKKAMKEFFRGFRNRCNAGKCHVEKNTAAPDCERWRWECAPLSREFALHLTSLFDRYHIDIVQAEMINLASTVFFVPENVKTVFVHHELSFVRHQLEMNQFGNGLLPRAMFEYARMAELGMLDRYDLVIVLSDTDKQKLADAGIRTCIATSSAVVCQNVYRPRIVSSKVLTFVGGDEHEPNLAAMDWFLENCWNRLKAADGGYKLKIISKWSEKNRIRILNSYRDVEFLGFVEELDTVFDGATMIVPITIGSGIRMKILEAASRGVPFVSTSIGAEGLPFKDGEHCYIKDEPSDFVQAILSVQDQTVRASFCEKARQVVSSDYSFEAFKEKRLRLYEC